MIRHRWIALACVLLLPIAVVGDDLIRLALSADAHRCCASTNGDCAQLSTPDNCCQTEQHAASQGYTTVAPGARVQITPDHSVALPAMVLPAAVLQQTGSTESTLTGIKRLHDPPHLHPFPLLI